MADEAVKSRMFDARQALESRERKRVTLEELGRRIGAADASREEGKPYDPPVVKRWLDGEPIEKMETWRAIAAVLGVRLGWLANGEMPMRDADGDHGAQLADAPPPASPAEPHTPRAVDRKPQPISVERLDKPASSRKRPPGRTAMAG